MPPEFDAGSRLGCSPDSMQYCRDRTADHVKVKCVLVGDGAVGKTSLIVSYTTNGFPTEYVPTAYDNYAVSVKVNNEPIQLQLCDTAGQDDFDLLRPLCYPNTDVFLLCFSVVCPTSFYNITDKWLPEIRTHSPASPIILVGTQSDLRNDVKVLIELAGYNERPISESEAASKLRDIGALTYIECSALTQHNLKEVFDLAVLTALNRRIRGDRKPLKQDGRQTCGRKSPTNNKYTTTHPPPPKRQPPTESSSRRHWWKKSFCCFM